VADGERPTEMNHRNGIEVREGHIVTIRGSSADVVGVVLKLILPGTADANTWSAPDGGVLIEGGGLGLSVTKSLESDEDVTFVRRAADGRSPRP
jgi:hypothetical protein